MEKIKLAIASILKPIDDTRMYEKFGLSLDQTNKYDINIIGFASKNIPGNQSINFFPLSPFPRLSFKRFIAPWRVGHFILKVKPSIIIVNTHELLIVISLYKILFGAKIIYDIQENYVKNILYTTAFPKLARPFIAGWVRLKEWLTRPFIKGYIIAEKPYQQELDFIKNSTLLLENKYKPIIPIKKEKETDDTQIKLLYSGTIATSYGVFDAINLAEKLHALEPRINLTIIGYCANRKDLLRLREKIQGSEFIRLIGGDYLVPHQEIVHEITQADFGLVLNQRNKSTDQKLPTRLFEYSAHHLPMLICENPLWTAFCDEFNAAITLNPSDFDVATILEKMKNTSFYDRGNTDSSLWESEEHKLISLINSLT